MWCAFMSMLHSAVVDEVLLGMSIMTMNAGGKINLPDITVYEQAAEVNLLVCII